MALYFDGGSRNWKKAKRGVVRVGVAGKISPVREFDR